MLGTTEDRALLEIAETYIDEKKVRVIIDMTKVDWISSAGISMFLAILTRLRNRGGDLRLANMSPVVFNLIDKCRLTMVLHPYGSLEEALKGF